VDSDAPTAAIDPQAFTGAQDHPGRKPLQDAATDSFLLGVAQGKSQRVAYQEFINKNCSNKTAQEQASRLINRPECKSRLAYIKLAARCLRTHLCRADLRNVLEIIVNTGRDGDKLLATKQLREMQDDEQRAADANKSVDPTQIVAQIGRWSRSGRMRDDLPKLLDALCELVKVTPAEIIATLQTGQDRAGATLTPHQEPMTDNQQNSSVVSPCGVGGLTSKDAV
jgi:hypothetical protein